MAGLEGTRNSALRLIENGALNAQLAKGFETGATPIGLGHLMSPFIETVRSGRIERQTVGLPRMRFTALGLILAGTIVALGGSQLIRVEALGYRPFVTSLADNAPISPERLTAPPLGLTFPPPRSATIRMIPSPSADQTKDKSDHRPVTP